jgi:hypothetical protein
VEGFVAWNGNRYSLPYDHVTEFLPVRITQTELFVYAADLSLIARHDLRPKGAGQDAVLPGHRPSWLKSGPPLEQLRIAFEEMGSEGADFLSQLERTQARSAGYHARRILALRERFHTRELVGAIGHAMRFGAFEHGAVERILEARATPRRLDEYVARETARKLDERIGHCATEPRDLKEYDAIPCWGQASLQGERACQENVPSQEQASDRGQPAPIRETLPFSRGSDSTSSGSD